MRLAPGREVGLDVARCLALLGMVATHVLDERGSAGGLSWSHELAGGRASALFAVLAGVSLVLMTGGRDPLPPGLRWPRLWPVAARALMIALLGLLLGALDTQIAVILTYYGVLFLLGLPFLVLRARSLVACAAAWVVAAPVLSHLIRGWLPECGWESPAPDQLATPGRLISELLFTGYYPAVPWLAYLLVGMALARLGLRGWRRAAMLAAGGVALAVAVTWISGVLTGQAAVRERLLADRPAADGAALLNEIAGGMYGTTPPDGSGAWLLVVAPHSGTPFDLAQTIGSALCVIGLCLLLVRVADRAWPGTGRRAAAVLFGAGTMTLTLYSLHVVMRTEAVWPAEVPASFRWHVLVLMGIGAVVVAAGRRGPLEWLVGMPARWRRA